MYEVLYVCFHAHVRLTTASGSYDNDFFLLSALDYVVLVAQFQHTVKTRCIALWQHWTGSVSIGHNGFENTDILLFSNLGSENI